MHVEKDMESVSCSACRWLFVSGEYRTCRYHGYVLHKDKGVSREECGDCMSEAQWSRRIAASRDAEKRKRK